MVENQPLKLDHLFYPLALLSREADLDALSNSGAFLNEKRALGHGVLTINLDAKNLFIPQARPKSFFTVCQILSQFTGFVFEICIVNQNASAPTEIPPSPLFQRGDKLALMPIQGEGNNLGFRKKNR